MGRLQIVDKWELKKAIAVKRVSKPNSVFPISRDGDHSSSPDVTIGIKQPTRKRRPDKSGHSDGPSACRFPIWPCTARSLPGRELLPATPVSSYLTLSPITRFYPGWSALCCTCRHPSPGARMLSGSLSYGVRTFLFCVKQKRSPDAFHYHGL